jgi:hypothetical protein
MAGFSDAENDHLVAALDGGLDQIDGLNESFVETGRDGGDFGDFGFKDAAGALEVIHAFDHGGMAS